VYKKLAGSLLDPKENTSGGMDATNLADELEIFQICYWKTLIAVC
jgi:hypothetical protein